jgi:hypothetical protein
MTIIANPDFSTLDPFFGHGPGPQVTAEGIVDDLVTVGDVVEELVHRLELDDDSPLARYMQYLAWGGPLGREVDGEPVEEGLGYMPLAFVWPLDLADQLCPIVRRGGEGRMNQALLAASVLFDFAIAQGYLEEGQNPAAWLLGMEAGD